MTWIGMTDLHDPVFDTRGIGTFQDRRGPDPGEGILPVGSLVTEVTYAARHRVPQRILRYERTHGWYRRLALMLSADGELDLEMQQGEARAQARLAFPAPPRETRLRISLSWNAPGRSGLITVENLDAEVMHQAEFDAPLPLPVEDAREIIYDTIATRIGHETRFLAVSDAIEPVGLSPGLAKGTPVETPTGPRLVERLRLGDLVETANAGPQPVRWITRREVPALGRFRPVRLRAPYFGLSRDILVSPDHRVAVTGPDAEYLTGEETVLAQAGHLIDGTAVQRESKGCTIRYYHILLDDHECVKHAGLWGESLFVGAIGRSRELIATTALGEMPMSAVPRHRRFARPILSALEARSLAASRAG